jgi:hypothetical protein
VQGSGFSASYSSSPQRDIHVRHMCHIPCESGASGLRLLSVDKAGAQSQHDPDTEGGQAVLTHKHTLQRSHEKSSSLFTAFRFTDWTREHELLD